MTERWASVPEFPNYEVSDRGRVRSTRTVLSSWRDRKGYLRVKLSRDGIKRVWLVHRLVLTAFVGPSDGLDGCHDNGVRTDNRLANLRWGTRSENIHDQVRHGTHANARKTHCPAGHPYSPENTYPNARNRACVTCARERARVRDNEGKSA